MTVEPVLLAATSAGQGRALWYFARASGLVAMVLLSATVVLGIVASVGWATERWPRFASQALHRNLSLLALAVIGVHIATIVGDGYVPISLADAVLPFGSPYRPAWVGLGACAFDLLLAVALTTALRRRLGARAWRAVHWLAYAAWPVALVHGLGAGTDTRLTLVELLYLGCTGAVVSAAVWRLSVAAVAARRSSSRTPPGAAPAHHRARLP